MHLCMLVCFMHLSMHYVKLLISALLLVHVHGAVYAGLVCWSHPLRRSEGRGRDRNDPEFHKYIAYYKNNNIVKNKCT